MAGKGGQFRAGAENVLGGGGNGGLRFHGGGDICLVHIVYLLWFWRNWRVPPFLFLASLRH